MYSEYRETRFFAGFISELEKSTAIINREVCIIEEFFAFSNELQNKIKGIEEPQVIYAHIQSGEHVIIYEEGCICYHNVILPKDAPLYANINGNFLKEKSRVLTADEIKSITTAIQQINIENMVSDKEQGCCGAAYNIFDCEYTNGRRFEYSSRFRPPIEFDMLYEVLCDYCEFEPDPIKTLDNLSF